MICFFKKNVYVAKKKYVLGINIMIFLFLLIIEVVDIWETDANFE